jgi:hypothetical protein
LFCTSISRREYPMPISRIDMERSVK